MPKPEPRNTREPTSDASPLPQRGVDATPTPEPAPDLRPAGLRSLATVQSALALRLDALENAVRHVRPGRDDPTEAARLSKLQEAVTDLAAAQHDAHRQLDALAGAVERLAAETLDSAPAPGDPVADDLRPATFVPPVEARGWRPRLKGWARVILRSTLGKVRLVWDATHPRPPWGDEIRLVIKDRPVQEPSLTVVISADLNADAVAGVEAQLERQTDHDSVRRIRANDFRNDANPPEIDTDYVWDIGPGLTDVPPTFVESARLLLASEDLDFVCFEGKDRAVSQWIVSSELHCAAGLDLDALSRRAKRHPGQVLGKILGGGPDLLPRALCRPLIRKRVRRSGPYIVAVATKPRTITHRLARIEKHAAAPRPARSHDAADGQPGVLLLLSDALAGGLERVVAAMLENLMREDLGKNARLVLASTVPQSPWSAERWRALERFTPHLYPLGDIFAEELHTDLIQELIARHGVHRLLHAGRGKTWPTLDATLRQRFPELHIAEPTLRLNVDCEPDAIPAGTRERLRAELRCPPEALLIVMCADLIPEQRPEDFVALAHRFRDDPNFQFLLLGDGPLNAALRDLERLFGLRNLRVERPERDPDEVLAAADIVCTTAESDPYPHAVAAALLHRRPVIAAAASDLPRLLEAGPCGLVVTHPGDLDGFEAALRSLATEELRQELGARGPRAVRDLYGKSERPKPKSK